MVTESVITEPSAVRSSDATELRDLGFLTRLKFMIARAFLWGWAWSFSLKGLYLFGQFFGTCEWLVNYKRRRRFRMHLERVLGQSLDAVDDPAMRWACLRHFTRTRCDKLFYLIFDKLPREKILHRLKFHGREILDEALERNKGAYICMSHVGSHHVSILLMALLGYKVAGVRDRKEGALRRYVQQKDEESFPEFRAIRMLFADAYPRDIYRCFQDGFVLGSALDVARDRGGHLRTTTAMLFGQPREFLIGPVQIALRCGAPILQGFVVSRKNFYFHIIIRGPLVDPDVAVDDPAVVDDVMQRYADNIGEHILQHPDHISKS